MSDLQILFETAAVQRESPVKLGSVCIMPPPIEGEVAPCTAPTFDFAVFEIPDPADFGPVAYVSDFVSHTLPSSCEVPRIFLRSSY